MDNTPSNLAATARCCAIRKREEATKGSLTPRGIQRVLAEADLLDRLAAKIEELGRTDKR